MRIAGAATDIGDNTAAIADLEAARAGQLVARPHAGREHQHGAVDGFAVRQRHPQPAAVVPDLSSRHTGVHGQTQPLDDVGQHRATALVDLKRHQPRTKLHDMRCQAHQPQRVCRFQAQQAAADHDAGGPWPGGLGHHPDRVEIVQRAIDEAAIGVLAGDRRHERIGAGGQHKRVVADTSTGRRGNGARRPRDGGDPLCHPQMYQIVTGVVVSGQGEHTAVPAVDV